MVRGSRLRSKTFTTHRDGVLQKVEFKKAYDFLGKKMNAFLSKHPEAKGNMPSMESYRVGKGQGISRAVVYWTERN
jgi:hypothetical protein